MKPSTRIKRLKRDVLALKLLLAMGIDEMLVEMYMQCLIDITGKGFNDLEDWATFLGVE